MCSLPPDMSRATAMPSAALSAVPACPAPKPSCSLSRAQHEAVQTTGLANRVEAVLAPGEELVYVALVADIEDKAVAGRVEHVMHGDSQFHHAEIGADMAAGFGNADDQPLADFFRQPLQFHHAEPLYIRRRFDPAQILTHAATSPRGPLINKTDERHKSLV